MKAQRSFTASGGDVTKHNAELAAATKRLETLQKQAAPLLQDEPRDVLPRHLPHPDSDDEDDEDDDEELEEQRPPPSPKKATRTREVGRRGGRYMSDFSATNALPCNAPSSVLRLIKSLNYVGFLFDRGDELCGQCRQGRPFSCDFYIANLEINRKADRTARREKGECGPDYKPGERD